VLPAEKRVKDEKRKTERGFAVVLRSKLKQPIKEIDSSESTFPTGERPVLVL
jgi:hypothetical protein